MAMNPNVCCEIATQTQLIQSWYLIRDGYVAIDFSQFHYAKPVSTVVVHHR